MIGPAIPHASLKKKQEKNEAEIEIAFSEDEQESTVGPQIPAHVLRKRHQASGPQIPDHIQNKDEIAISDEEDDKTPSIGAQIPQARVTGPFIPDDLIQQRKNPQNTGEIVISNNEDNTAPSIGPQIPQARIVGPSIPDHLIQQRRNTQNTDEIAISDQDDDNVGPQIPKQSSAEDEENPDNYAPALPPDLIEQRQKQQQQQPTGTRRRRPLGPTFPTGPSRDEDYDTVGPALPKDYNPEEEAKYSAIRAIEERAKQSKEAMEKKEQDAGKIQRPEWMLVPPEVDYLKKANSSRSRQFTNKTMTKEELDNTEWTETPAEKQLRLQGQRSGKRKMQEETDTYSALDMEKRRNVEQYNMKTRPLSLLEMHQQKKKKKGITAEEDVTKRAFDREKDIVGHKRLDHKQKKELFKKSTELGQKFGYGNSSFL